MLRFVMHSVYLLCSGLNKEDERHTSFRDPLLHYHAPRLIALRGETERGNPRIIGMVFDANNNN